MMPSCMKPEIPLSTLSYPSGLNLLRRRPPARSSPPTKPKREMSCSLNSLKAEYIGDYMGDYHKGS